MKPKIAVIISPEGAVQVLTDDASVQVLVLQPAGSTEPSVATTAYGAVSAHSVAHGLPHLKPAAVQELFAQVLPALPAAGQRLSAIDHVRLTHASTCWAQP